jgi:hypothetical protein
MDLYQAYIYIKKLFGIDHKNLILVHDSMFHCKFIIYKTSILLPYTFPVYAVFL